ncbi:uncharacterized protein L969DRAFT_83857 [Mixia osmundae IAM 14324]|uniref:N-acetyltransferase domain-containing protein n=1 Tax=Mixia osmundae (strain CBS 9802 / IAM 14324 / JCM 22182 / KY 12970) TaxID=764103 RepID=G7E3Z6_MIXOS|nr:uncharacterized protein L969DRAFT_83857 [Mixia osmundae IAM 14324]KEI42003.1 hypothetical protein L969DRAFT_83857 [Mixia osmundae IAM 14324]GAA97556.1 hypothetical protein E5Q_04234 [Mixia osmundae IAM 14324]
MPPSHDVTFKVEHGSLSEPTKALLAQQMQLRHSDMQLPLPFVADFTPYLDPKMTVHTLWFDHDLACVGALKLLDDGETGELKTFRTQDRHLRKGAATTLLKHITKQSRTQGLSRLSLETGTMPRLYPAVELYKKLGFTVGEPFAAYTYRGDNQFLHLVL